ncbi:T-complex protein 1 subunit beta [Trichinella pseudospiralis]|uniref:T-complex protein 1 subunit beta n=3 Tax=Trichinella pseudospiralis TaxID=6337 RepID=A0A0V1JX64_TRIPS|nr:T-complex protein 1 subunit beta [Trichinella pseudospiralis]KRY88084.1 T-complex protein 1 subunit beta [Trichinella pseudospiralis]KRZ33123.1 T-complex protein 1 subunit beta [Trichinella pseudospiralis]KRZ39600.1 T-complex protein 1 subunit beta [Trichinella pseudospiralis]
MIEFPVVLNPVQILKRDADEEKGSAARMSSYAGAMALGDMLKSTLGPKGMDKILIGGREGGPQFMHVTNDGATILKSVGVANPAAKILVDISLVQDTEVGDGTTTVAVLAAQLLHQAELLIESGIHPQIIIRGWRQALQAARAKLADIARISSNDPEIFREELLNLACTALGSKILASHKKLFAEIAVNAVLRTKNTDLSCIHVITLPGGRLTDSFLDSGFLLQKKAGNYQPNRIENARVLIANTPMDTDKIKVFSAQIVTDSINRLRDLEIAEKAKMKKKVDKIIAHNVNVFINRQLIYNYPEQLFADAKIMAIEHADFDGITRLAHVLGGDIVSTFDNPKQTKLGSCELIEEVEIGDEKFLRFSGVPVGEACTIVLRGATQQILAEAERSIHDVLCVLTTHIKEPKIVDGGGCSEIAMANAVQSLATRTAGKISVAMDGFAKALCQIPAILAENGGYDAADLVAKLRADHFNGNKTFGIDLKNGTINDMKKLGVFESYRVKLSALNAAAEAAELIIRVDDILSAEPRPREPDDRPC